MPRPTSRPLTAPQRAPVAMAAMTITMMEFVMLKAMMETPVQRTREEPTERSIWPVIMTQAIPRAIVPTITVFWLLRIAAMWLHLKVLPLELMVMA